MEKKIRIDGRKIEGKKRLKIWNEKKKKRKKRNKEKEKKTERNDHKREMKKKKSNKKWFCLVVLNGISTFVRLFNAKVILLEEQ